MFDARQVAAEAIEKGENPLAAVVFQALGATSVCWVEQDGERVFDSEQAEGIGVELLLYISETHASKDKAEVYRDKAGKFRYRIVAGNGLNVDAATQGYSTRWSAGRAARRGRKGVKLVQIRR